MIRRIAAFGTLLAALIAVLPAHADEVAPERAFDFWIGEWDVDNFNRRQFNAPEDPTFYPTGRAVARVYPLLGGRAIVEHWRGHLSWGRVDGFSVRTYDTDQKKWVVVLNWITPFAPKPSFFTVEGGFHHGRGEMHSTSTDALGRTVLNRFTFSDITPERFRWDGAVSLDSTLTWRTNWVMEAHRRGPMDPPLFIGPTQFEQTPRCPGADHRRLDGFVGTWSTPAGGDGGARLIVQPILGGCAQMSLVEVDGPGAPWQRFAVRAFDEASGEWVQYALDSRGGGFVRSTGRPSSGGDVVFDARAAGGREYWSRGSGGQKATWRLERGPRGRLGVRVELTRLE